ncbi:MAG TPA: hypothetical protein VN253_11485, partial [Kofleriaceae bacterium]|nr:hypothetical protein [Kofleriaceae bacterium]
MRTALAARARPGSSKADDQRSTKKSSSTGPVLDGVRGSTRGVEAVPTGAGAPGLITVTVGVPVGAAGRVTAGCAPS